MWERTGCMMETCAMETCEVGGNSLCPCVSHLHPLFFLAAINTFRRLLWRLHRSKTSLTLLDSLTWAMLRYASLNFSKTNTKLLWQGECLISLISQQFYQTCLLCYWCCFVTIFVSPLSKIAAQYLSSLSKACICHKTITKIARLCQKFFCQTGNF